MSAKATETAIRDAVKCVTGIKRESGLSGLRVVDEAGWKTFGEAFWTRHAPANFKVSAREGVLEQTAEEHDSYMLAFVTAATSAAEGILTANWRDLREALETVIILGDVNALRTFVVAHAS